MNKYDVTVIGGGPAGLAAAIEAKREDKNVLLIEREGRLGGILKQCIHDGFGIIRFGERLTGPEYVERYMKDFSDMGIEAMVLTFVTDIKKKDDGTFEITVVNKEGVHQIQSSTIVFATGCRERTAKQVFIHGTRPSGVFTAGTAQHFVNLQGQMPTKKCVILGSGDIGLIMARRLTLEGAEVVGVYEAKDSPSGLTRNMVQCLDDFNIPLHLSHTVTKVFGHDRLTGVEISQVDKDMKPIPGTEEYIECDGLILSVGLIPENEIAESLGVEMDPRTKGPVCDSRFMTSVPGIFICGNALHVNDLVDYVSESGVLAGKAAAKYEVRGRDYVSLNPDSTLQYVVPQKISLGEVEDTITLYFRTREPMEEARLEIKAGDKLVFSKHYTNLKPPEMERLELDFKVLAHRVEDGITISLKDDE